jgi:prepilin-type processing-associated H-X9-DG protein
MRHPLAKYSLRSLAGIVALLALYKVLIALCTSASDGGDVGLRFVCSSNLRLMGLAVLNYTESYGTFPTGTVFNPALPPTRRLSWITQIFGRHEYGDELLFDPTEAWDAEVNRVPVIRPSRYGKRLTTLQAGEVHVLHCPSLRHSPASPKEAGASDFVGITGLGTDTATVPTTHPRAGIFGYDRVTRPADIKDGLSNTLLAVETAIAKGPFMAGGPATLRGLDPSRKPYFGPGRQFGGIHSPPGGANVLFADGAVLYVRETVDPKVFEAASTIAGGEPLDQNEWFK